MPRTQSRRKSPAPFMRRAWISSCSIPSSATSKPSSPKSRQPTIREEPMSNIFRVARKELASFFSSLAAFIFIGVFLAVCLFTFFWVSRFFARNIADIRPLFEWMPVLLIFLVSGLTMRMWSEERRAGTLEFLMTSPAKPIHLVLGKFLACLALVAIALALTLPLPIVVSAIGPLDWGPVIGGY